MSNFFDKLLNAGEFPEEWPVGIIVILFKGRESNNLNNHRGITLPSILSKHLVGILNKRLNLLKKIKLVNENQAGFRKGYRTTDHIFPLSSIINHT